MPRDLRRHLLAALLALAPTSVAGCRPEARPPPLHGIVLVGLDTLRADGLSCYGNPRPTSPAICELAGRGHLFENAISNTSWTLPGFIAILSGELPSRRIYESGLTRSGAERLRDAGYRTAAFTEGGWVSREAGLAVGFESWWEGETEAIYQAGAGGGAALTFARAQDWLREHGREPFFLFVHTYEPHVPYEHMDFAEGLDPGGLGGPYDRTQTLQVAIEALPVGPTELHWVRALYDSDVLATDRGVGALLATLAELGLAERTAVVLTADHGEQLGEHEPRQLGVHGQTLRDTVLRVPLVVYDPRRPDGGRRIAGQVRTVDVMPTLLDLAGLAPDPASDGGSLVPMMDGLETADRPAYSELREDTGRLLAASLRTNAFKIVLKTASEEEPEEVELYDLRRDPEEQHDIARQRAGASERLHEALRRRVERIEARAPFQERKDLSPELRRRLRELGYLDDDPE